jgi:hypothetical protein
LDKFMILVNMTNIISILEIDKLISKKKNLVLKMDIHLYTFKII